MSNIEEEMAGGRLIVAGDVECFRRIYTEVLGGRTVLSGEATHVVGTDALRQAADPDWADRHVHCVVDERSGKTAGA